MDPKDSLTANERTVDDLLDKHFDKPAVQLNSPNDEEEDDLPVPEEAPLPVENSDTEDEGVAEDEIITPTQLLELRKQVLDIKESGNACFRKGDFEEAILLYRKAASLCRYPELLPEKAILYSNRAASELKLNVPKPAIHSASRAIKFNPNFPKGYLRRAKAYDLEDKLEESLEDYKKVLELDRQSKEALDAIPGLERRINERNEKMKEEMMSKLKDLGNLVLRPFGLSTNNFQMNQSESGGYSINFKQN